MLWTAASPINMLVNNDFPCMLTWAEIARPAKLHMWVKPPRRIRSSGRNTPCKLHLGSTKMKNEPMTIYVLNLVSCVFGFLKHILRTNSRIILLQIVCSILHSANNIQQQANGKCCERN